MKNWTLKELKEICAHQWAYEKDICTNCPAKEFCKIVESGQTPANVEIEEETTAIQQQAEREALKKLVTKLSERSVELKKQEQKYILEDDVETAVRFNVALQEVNRLLNDINELLKEACGE